MTSSGKIIRRIWRGWAFFCGGAGLLLVCLIGLATLKQSRQDASFVNSEIIPLARYVEAFRDSHHQLPSEAEFNSWAETNRENKAVFYYHEKPSFMSEWGMLGVNR